MEDSLKNENFLADVILFLMMYLHIFPLAFFAKKDQEHFLGQRAKFEKERIGGTNNSHFSVFLLVKKESSSKKASK